MRMRSKPEVTLLMTCVGGELAPQAIRLMQQSARYRVRVVGVDASPHAVGRHFSDAFHVVPRGSDPAYVQALRDVVAKEAVQIVLPSSDEEALALSANRTSIESKDTVLACTDASTIRTFASKAATYSAIAAAGLPVPEWHEVASLDEMRACVQTLLKQRGEAVVKPSGGRGSRGAIVIRKDIDGVAAPLPGAREVQCGAAYFFDRLLSECFASLPAIVMQRLQEPVHDIDLLGWRGNDVRIVARRRLDSQRPNEGHRIVDDRVLADLGRRLIEHFRLSWLYDCDVMFDTAGTPYVVEINPRPSGSVTVTIRAGIPLYDDVIALARGEEVTRVDVPTGHTVVPYRALHLAPQ